MNKIYEGTYGKIYKEKVNGKEEIIKWFKYGIFDTSSIKEIYIYLKLKDYKKFIKLKKINTKNNTITFKKYNFNLDEFIKINGPYTDMNIIKNHMYNLLEQLYILSLNNIIHRDIKPENIIIHFGKIFIIDFGLSLIGNYNKYLSEKLSYSVYTEWWRPPEITNYEFYDQKSDVWALGFIFLKLKYKFTDYDLYNYIINKDNTILMYKHLKKYFSHCYNKYNDKEFLLLISNMLDLDIKTRFNIIECMNNIFLNKNYDSLKIISSINEKKYYKIYNKNFIYNTTKNRKIYFRKIVDIYVENSLSIQSLLLSLMLYDNNIIYHYYTAIYIATMIYDGTLKYIKDIEYEIIYNLEFILNYINENIINPCDILIYNEKNNKVIVNKCQILLERYLSKKYKNMQDLFIDL